jgi:hypothetical protein
MENENIKNTELNKFFHDLKKPIANICMIFDSFDFKSNEDQIDNSLIDYLEKNISDNLLYIKNYKDKNKVSQKVEMIINKTILCYDEMLIFLKSYKNSGIKSSFFEDKKNFFKSSLQEINTLIHEALKND